jgi:hypothetical protein
VLTTCPPAARNVDEDTDDTRPKREERHEPRAYRVWMRVGPQPDRSRAYDEEQRPAPKDEETEAQLYKARLQAFAHQVSSVTCRTHGRQNQRPRELQNACGVHSRPPVHAVVMRHPRSLSHSSAKSARIPIGYILYLLYYYLMYPSSSISGCIPFSLSGSSRIIKSMYDPSSSLSSMSIERYYPLIVTGMSNKIRKRSQRKGLPCTPVEDLY